MLELPEATVLAQQLNQTVKGKKITRITAARSPHKFAWFNGDPKTYSARLTGKSVGESIARGGWVEVQVEDAVLLFSDGVNLRYHAQGEPRPAKHQLLLEFADASTLSASVQMYGGLWCSASAGGLPDNPYYKAAVEKPSPLSESFSPDYFEKLLEIPDMAKLSLKALLATEQRIPGVGNGVLQDILFNSGLHPKKKAGSLNQVERERLFQAIKSTLADMVQRDGRDTEKDLFGQPGGYITRLSKNTAGKPCSKCGTLIKKEAYMGGSIYYCSICQKI